MGVLSEVKSAVELAKETGNPELRQALLDAQGKVQEMYDQLLGLREENQALRERIEGLREELTVKQDLRTVGDVYVLEEDGGWRGPFCTRCWDVDRRLVRFRDANRDERANTGLTRGHIVCPECESAVLKPEGIDEDDA